VDTRQLSPAQVAYGLVRKTHSLECLSEVNRETPSYIGLANLRFVYATVGDRTIADSSE